MLMAWDATEHKGRRCPGSVDLSVTQTTHSMPEKLGHRHPILQAELQGVCSKGKTVNELWVALHIELKYCMLGR